MERAIYNCLRGRCQGLEPESLYWSWDGHQVLAYFGDGMWALADLPTNKRAYFWVPDKCYAQASQISLGSLLARGIPELVQNPIPNWIRFENAEPQLDLCHILGRGFLVKANLSMTLSMTLSQFMEAVNRYHLLSHSLEVRSSFEPSEFVAAEITGQSDFRSPSQYPTHVRVLDKFFCRFIPGFAGLNSYGLLSKNSSSTIIEAQSFVTSINHELMERLYGMAKWLHSDARQHSAKGDYPFLYLRFHDRSSVIKFINDGSSDCAIYCLSIDGNSKTPYLPDKVTISSSSGVYRELSRYDWQELKFSQTYSEETQLFDALNVYPDRISDLEYQANLIDQMSMANPNDNSNQLVLTNDFQDLLLVMNSLITYHFARTSERPLDLDLIFHAYYKPPFGYAFDLHGSFQASSGVKLYFQIDLDPRPFRDNTCYIQVDLPTTQCIPTNKDYRDLIRWYSDNKAKLSNAGLAVLSNLPRRFPFFSSSFFSESKRHAKSPSKPKGYDA